MFEKNALLLAFLLALGASLGTLFYSEIVKLAPCKLCWYQRTMMYPLTFILGTAYLRRFKNIFYYVTPVAIVGSLVALYHILLQNALIPLALQAACSLDGAECGVKYFSEFGYISMPVMSLTVFISIIVLTYIKKSK